MARLNMIKMLGLVLLLVVALTLPSVLPKTAPAANAHINTPLPGNRSNV